MSQEIAMLAMTKKDDLERLRQQREELERLKTELAELKKQKEQWDKIPTTALGSDSGEGYVVRVDNQFQQALAKLMTSMESETHISNPDELVNAMRKLAGSITGGQFDIVNSMLKDSEVKFATARPSYSLINMIRTVEDLERVYRGNAPAFETQEQWVNAKKALLDKVVVGSDIQDDKGGVHHAKGIVEMMKEHPNARISVDIIGYTDEVGEEENNNDLGMRRACFIRKIVELLLQSEVTKNGLPEDAWKRVYYRCLSSGEMNLPRPSTGESQKDYNARCRCISITVKVDAKQDL